MRLYRLLGEEEPFTDLTVYETVGDELEDLCLASSRLLLEPPHRRLERDDLASGLGTETVPSRGNLVEASRMVEVAREDFLAFRSVHAKWDRPRRSPAHTLDGGKSSPPIGGSATPRSGA